MQTTIEQAGVKAKVISPSDGHYFFGYYDLQPFDSTGRYHLCHKAAFEDHIPEPHESCELGVLDLQTGEFIKFAETTAWNFQQGAMLQWCGDDDHVIFNVRRDGSYKACILNIKTGEERLLPMAIANLSKDCTKALCINMSRIFSFRPGYGYAGVPDPFAEQLAPAEDGVWVMDIATGECSPVVTLQQIKERFPKSPYTDQKLLINHITFSPTAKKFVMFVRNQPVSGSTWATAVIICDLQGNMTQLAEYGTHSHYHWKNDDEFLVVSQYNDDSTRPFRLWLFDVNTGDGTEFPEPCPEDPIIDIHCLYSPNQTHIMGDAYPKRNHPYRALHFIEADTFKDMVVGEYYSYTPNNITDIRCDLHARFDQTGRYVSFDSNHVGRRCVCLLDLNELTDCKYKHDSVPN